VHCDEQLNKYLCGDYYLKRLTASKAANLHI
jgi:hypothetical protein